MTYNTAKEREAAMRAEKAQQRPRKNDSGYVIPLKWTTEELKARKAWLRGLDPAGGNSVKAAAKKAGVDNHRMGKIHVGKNSL